MFEIIVTDTGFGCLMPPVTTTGEQILLGTKRFKLICWNRGGTHSEIYWKNLESLLEIVWDQRSK